MPIPFRAMPNSEIRGTDRRASGLQSVASCPNGGGWPSATTTVKGMRESRNTIRLALPAGVISLFIRHASQAIAVVSTAEARKAGECMASRIDVKTSLVPAPKAISVALGGGPVPVRAVTPIQNQIRGSVARGTRAASLPKYPGAKASDSAQSIVQPRVLPGVASRAPLRGITASGAIAAANTARRDISIVSYVRLVTGPGRKRMPDRGDIRLPDCCPKPWSSGVRQPQPHPAAIRRRCVGGV